MAQPLIFRTDLRSAMVGVIKEVVNLGNTAAPKLVLYSDDSPPTDLDVSPDGVLAVLTLPTSWLGTQSNGQVAMSGTWSTNSASDDGTAHTFRILDDNNQAWIQGGVSGMAGDEMLKMNDPDIVQGQEVEIESFVIIAGNAAS